MRHTGTASYGNLKCAILEQRHTGTAAYWNAPYVLECAMLDLGHSGLRHSGTEPWGGVPTLPCTNNQMG